MHFHSNPQSIGIEWAHIEQRRNKVYIMGGDIYWRGLAVSMKLPTWFRLYTISNLMNAVRVLALLTVHTIMRYHADPKLWGKAFYFFFNSRKFSHIYFPEYTHDFPLIYLVVWYGIESDLYVGNPKQFTWWKLVRKLAQNRISKYSQILVVFGTLTAYFWS